MGWTYGWRSREELVKELEDPAGYQPGLTIVETRLVGNGREHWMLLERNGERFIVLNLLEAIGAQWGYKHMDESMGPCYYGCPVEWLEKAPQAPGPYAAGWREKVRLYHVRNDRSAAAVTRAIAQKQIERLGGATMKQSVTITGCPVSLNGQLLLADAIVTVDFAEVAAQRIANAVASKSKKSTVAFGAVIVQASNVRRMP